MLGSILANIKAALAAVASSAVWKFLAGLAGLAAAATGIVALVKFVANRVQEYRENKTPYSMLEAAISTPETRRSNPELNAKYEYATTKSAKKIVSKYTEDIPKIDTDLELGRNYTREFVNSVPVLKDYFAQKKKPDTDQFDLDPVLHYSPIPLKALQLT